MVKKVVVRKRSEKKKIYLERAGEERGRRYYVVRGESILFFREKRMGHGAHPSRRAPSCALGKGGKPPSEIIAE